MATNHYYLNQEPDLSAWLSIDILTKEWDLSMWILEGHTNLGGFHKFLEGSIEKFLSTTPPHSTPTQPVKSPDDVKIR